MSKRHISGILSQYMGRKEEVIADLTVYLDNPVGVGEHSDIGTEIKSKIEEIHKLDSLIETVRKYFGSDGTTNEQTSNTSD